MAFKEIETERITKTVRGLCIEANTVLDDDTIAAYEKALAIEESPVGKDIFRQLLENAAIAKEEGIAVCQDTGVVVVFVALGQDVHIVGGDLNEAIHEGVRQGYKDGYFRASTLDPITRKNFGDNTPAVIHIEVAPGDTMKLTVLPKGFGGEMMSQVVLFHPAVGMQGVKEFIVQRVNDAGGKRVPRGLWGLV